MRLASKHDVSGYIPALACKSVALQQLGEFDQANQIKDSIPPGSKCNLDDVNRGNTPNELISSLSAGFRLLQ
jgi:hypothetical protein